MANQVDTITEHLEQISTAARRVGLDVSTVDPQPVVEGDPVAPPERSQLRAVEGIAPVVAGAILHRPDERPGLAEGLEEQPYDIAIGQLGRAGDVVRLTSLATSQDAFDRPGVVGHE